MRIGIRKFSGFVFIWTLCLFILLLNTAQAQLTAEEILELKKKGVSDEIIKKLMAVPDVEGTLDQVRIHFEKASDYGRAGLGIDVRKEAEEAIRKIDNCLREKDDWRLYTARGIAYWMLADVTPHSDYLYWLSNFPGPCVGPQEDDNNSWRKEHLLKAEHDFKKAVFLRPKFLEAIIFRAGVCSNLRTTISKLYRPRYRLAFGDINFRFRAKARFDSAVKEARECYANHCHLRQQYAEEIEFLKKLGLNYQKETYEDIARLKMERLQTCVQIQKDMIEEEVNSRGVEP